MGNNFLVRRCEMRLSNIKPAKISVCQLAKTIQLQESCVSLKKC